MTYKEYFTAMRGISRALAEIATRTHNMAWTGQGGSENPDLQALFKRQQDLTDDAVKYEKAVIEANGIPS